MTTTRERHARGGCTLCLHPQRQEIEREIVEWQPIARIARQFRLNRRVIYRHARACALFTKRDKNIRMALARFIERCGNVRPTASAFVQAVAVFSRINANGLWINRNESTNMNDLFAQMSNAELEAYATRGELPRWYAENVRGTEGLLEATSGQAVVEEDH